MKQEILISTPGEFSRSLGGYGIAVFQVILGSIFLALMAQLAVPLPFTPIYISLSTLGVALLTITLGSHKGTLAVAAYLLQASFGLPVLAGGLASPLWMVGPKGGYLLAFAISTFVVGRILEKQRQLSFIQSWLFLSLNEIIVLTIGSLWLGFFVGWNYAFVMGVLPFLPGALVKITIAAASLKPMEWVKFTSYK